jgi:chemotaxis receptor (MCP) glutamine deamidase CheD
VHNRLRNDNKRIRFHEIVDGEIVVADDSAVLEMVLDESVGMIIHDRGRRLAAASKLCVRPSQESGTDIRERTSSASLALLARLAALGCRPESLEIYALGAVDADAFATGASGAGVRRVAFAMGLPANGRARRVEFDVALGRIVVEQHCGMRA